MLPPEPVRFSTITGWPSASPRRGASARAVVRVGRCSVSRRGGGVAGRLDHVPRVFYRKISRGRAEGLGGAARGAQVADHGLGAAVGFLPVLGDGDDAEVRKAIRRGRGPAEIGAGLAIVIEQFLRLEAREKSAEHVAALGDLADVLRRG